MSKLKVHLDDYADVSCMSVESIEKKLDKTLFGERAFITISITPRFLGFAQSVEDLDEEELRRLSFHTGFHMLSAIKNHLGKKNEKNSI